MEVVKLPKYSNDVNDGSRKKHSVRDLMTCAEYIKGSVEEHLRKLSGYQYTSADSTLVNDLPLAHGPQCQP